MRPSLFIAFGLLLPLLVSAQKIDNAIWFVRPIMSGFDTFHVSKYNNEHLTAIKNGKVGLVSIATGRIVIPFEWKRVNLGAPTTRFIGVEGDVPGTGGFYSAAGLFMSKGYDKCECSTANGGCFVQKGGKWGFIDSVGNVVEPLEYDKKDWAVKTQAYELTKKTGEKKSFPEPAWSAKKKLKDLPRIAKEGPWSRLIRLEKSGRSGIMTLDGDTLQPPNLLWKGDHPSGYARVATTLKTVGLMDTLGKWVFQPEFEGFQMVNDDLTVWAKKGGKWALLRIPSGGELVPYGTYDDVKTVGNGLFEFKKAEKVGIFDGKNTERIPIQYDNISVESQLTGRLGINKKYGTWWPKTGFRVEPQYDLLQNTKEDSIVFVSRDSLFALMDAKTGAELTPFLYSKITKNRWFYFCETKILGTKNVMTTVVDKTGRTVFAPEQATFFGFPDETFFVQKTDGTAEHRRLDGSVIRAFGAKTASVHEGYWFAVKNPGEAAPRYFRFDDPPNAEIWLESVGKTVDGLRVFKKNGRFGYFDNIGKTVVEPVLDLANNPDSGLIKVKFDGKWGVLENPPFKK